MSSNQHEIKYMLGSLKVMQEKLGGGAAKRTLAGTEFDFIQEEFLTKRHEVEKWQDTKDREGITTKTADIAYKIREGVPQLKDLLTKLESEYDRLEKKRKDTPAVLASKKKIVGNCQKLYRDIEERYKGSGDPTVGKQYQTLTDMKAKLLSEIDTANNNIQHQYNSGSEDMLEEIDEEEVRAMDAYQKKEEEMDVVLDEIVVGLQEVRRGVRNINDKQDEINQKVAKQNVQVAKMNKRIERDNDKLKVIIEKFNSTKCCLVVFLLLLIIGLVVVIIRFVIPHGSA